MDLEKELLEMLAHAEAEDKFRRLVDERRLNVKAEELAKAIIDLDSKTEYYSDQEMESLRKLVADDLAVNRMMGIVVAIADGSINCPIPIKITVDAEACMFRVIYCVGFGGKWETLMAANWRLADDQTWWWMRENSMTAINSFVDGYVAAHSWL